MGLRPAAPRGARGRATGTRAATREWMVGGAATIADFSLSGYLFYPPEESGYAVAGRYPHIEAWLARLRGLPGRASPYDVLPGERLLPKW